MEFILASAGDLSPLLTQALGRYRHRVFVETLGWQLDTPPGIERDDPSLVHVSKTRRPGGWPGLHALPCEVAQAAAAGRSSNCSSSVEPFSATVEDFPP